MIEKNRSDITKEELILFEECGYVCIDTETTGLNYLTDRLCTIQLYAGNTGILIYFSETTKYPNLIKLLMSKKILKIFHNAVFDVSFLMTALRIDNFGILACTKISSKLMHGLEYNNSLKHLLKEYLDIEIEKTMQLSDWSKETLSLEQKEYAMNDVRYLYSLWILLAEELKEAGLLKLAYDCFEFVPRYKSLTDMGINNIFTY